MDFRKTIDLYRAFMYPENVYNSTNWIMWNTSHSTNRIMWNTSHRAAVKRGKKKRRKNNQ